MNTKKIPDDKIKELNSKFLNLIHKFMRTIDTYEKGDGVHLLLVVYDEFNNVSATQLKGNSKQIIKGFKGALQESPKFRIFMSELIVDLL